MALTDSLISYWKLDEASGNALDAHGANDLTADGFGSTPGTAAGVINTARSFNRTNAESFYRADNSDLSSGDIDLTVAFWFKVSSQPGTQVFVHKGGDIGTHEYTSFLSGGAVFFRVQNAAASVSTGSVSNGVWYHVVVWHDSVNNEIGVAVNAGTPATASYSGGITDAGDRFQIGGDSGGGRTVDGYMDEVGFWKRVLTSQERTDLYNGGAGLAYPFSVAGGRPAVKRMGGVRFAHHLTGPRGSRVW